MNDDSTPNDEVDASSTYGPISPHNKEWIRHYQKRMLNEIRWETLRQPSILGRPFYLSVDWYRERVARKITHQASEIRRELRADERDALAEAAASASHVWSLVPAVALMSIAFFHRRGRKNMKFCLWTQAWKPDLNFFPSQEPLLRGRYARFAWNTVRLINYSIVNVLGLSLAAFCYDLGVPDVKAMLDVRLADYQKQHDRVIEAEINEYRRLLGLPPTTKWWEDPPTNTPSQPPASPRQTQEAQSTRSGDDSSFYDHDASPAAPTAQQPAQGAAEPDATKPKETTSWEEIRLRAAESTQSSWAQRRQEAVRNNEGVVSGDRYSYSSSEGENAYAKDQAQNEFDAMVERERRGESPDDR